MPKLKPLPLSSPCPYCRSDNIWAINDGHEFWVFCKECSTSGPMADTEYDAFAVWNALPRALTWGEEPPSVPGFYWWRCKKEQPDSPLMVLVDIDSAGKLSSFFIYGVEPSFHECDDCQWAHVTPPRE